MTESNYHLLTCSSNTTSLRKIITETVNETLAKYDITNRNISHQLITSFVKNISYTNTQTKLTRVTLGMVSKNDINLINKTAKVPKSKCSLAVYILHKIAHRIYKEIWLTRCKIQNENTSKTNHNPLVESHQNVTTVSTALQDMHSEQMIVTNTEIKLETWRRMFVLYNTSPEYINSIID